MRRRDKFLIAIPFVVLLIVLFAAGFSYLTLFYLPRVRVAGELEAIRAKGEPITLVQLDAWNSPSAEQEQGASILRQAFDAYRGISDPSLDVPLFTNNEWAARGVPLAPEARAAIDQLLAQNDKCFALLREGRASGESRLNFATLKEGPIPEIESVKALGNLVALQSLAFADSGKSDDALRTAELGIWLSQTLHSEPTFIAMLVSGKLREVALRSVEHALSCSPASEQSLHDLRVELGRCVDERQFYRALVGERCVLIDSIRSNPMLAITQQNDLDFGITVFHELLSASTLGPVDRHREFRRIGDFYIEGDRGILEVTRAMSVIWLTPLVHSNEAADRLLAELRIADLGLAIELWRTEHGTLPKSLNDLVPKYINAVPEDPFDGEPMRYIVKDGGFVVYSVNVDREDDGGLDPETAEKKLRRVLDLVFVVAR